MRNYKTLIAAIVLLLFSTSINADQEDSGTDSKKLSFFVSTTRDLLSMSHGKSVPLAEFPEGIPSLAGTPLDNMLAFTSVIRDDEGVPVGLASELEEFPKVVPEGSPMIWDTLWTLLIQGRGSLYLYQQEIMIMEDATIFAKAVSSGKTWEGSVTHPTTYGPLPSARGVIKGGTGEFAGVTGTFQEIVTLQKFTPQGELEALVELRIELKPD